MIVILLVEDDEMSRDVLSRRLARFGYVVITAVNGRQALETARKNRPDLILMDMCMPEMDGFDATRSIKADSQMASIPVIALTALNTAVDVRRAIQSGCDSYETKPVNVSRLKLKIEKLLPDAFEEK